MMYFNNQEKKNFEMQPIDQNDVIFRQQNFYKLQIQAIL